MSKDGGSAFPQVESQQVGSQGDYHTEVYSVGGMSLRDYLAAKAMQAALVNASLPGLADRSNADAIAAVDQMAAACYFIADAMLAARKAG